MHASSALFVVCAALAVVSAVATVAAKRPLRAAVALLAHMVALAGLYLGLHAPVLAALQLFVYAGAVVTLFVLVVTMIGAGGDNAAGRQPRSGISPLPRVAGLSMAILLGGMLFMALVAPALMPTVPGCLPSTACRPFGSLAWLGQALLAQRWLAVELVGVLLLVAAVAAMAIHGRK